MNDAKENLCVGKERSIQAFIVLKACFTFIQIIPFTHIYQYTQSQATISLPQYRLLPHPEQHFHCFFKYATQPTPKAILQGASSTLDSFHKS